MLPKDDVFSPDYEPPPRTAQEIAEDIAWKQEAKQRRRILKAMDENVTMCAECGVTFMDTYHAILQAAVGQPYVLEKCKSPFRDCKAKAEHARIVSGPPPRVLKITAKRTAAFRKRKRQAAS